MLWLLAAVVAIVVAVVFDPKWVLAPLIGLFVYKVGTASLRSLARDARGGPASATPGEGGAPREEPLGRTFYWCEQCGAQLALVVRGVDTPPRHCGERMHERTEVPSERDLLPPPRDRAS